MARKKIAEKPVITRECVTPLFETKFLKLYDLQYAPGKHYYDATRHSADDIAAVKAKDDFRKMIPDAVSCIVVLCPENDAPRLLTFNEFRYPTGQFLLSIPAGLIDEKDRAADGEGNGAALHPALRAAKREIFEETGLALGENDTLRLVSPLLFSSPGMTDESNALALAVVKRGDFSFLTQEGAEGSEVFDGFFLLTEEEAREILQRGTDKDGIFYSVYTWMALTWFVTGLWK